MAFPIDQVALPIDQQILRLVCALVLGSIIGIERERSSHAAGFRTHALVCVGAALIILVSTYGFSDVEGTEGVGLDPSRIAAQVVSGIGFIGAGTIIVQRSNVRGLTTAAGLWTVAAIGLACGAGMFIAAFTAAFIALMVLVPLKYIEQRLLRSKTPPVIAAMPAASAPPVTLAARSVERRYQRRGELHPHRAGRN